MIPRAFVTEWQHTAPWVADEQIEQDLILSRILVEIYQNDFIKEQLVFDYVLLGSSLLIRIFAPG